MMMLGIVQLNASWYGKTSQFYMNERPQETCAKYWWRNLLYINNLFSRKTMVRTDLGFRTKRLNAVRRGSHLSYVSFFFSSYFCSACHGAGTWRTICNSSWSVRSYWSCRLCKLTDILRRARILRHVETKKYRTREFSDTFTRRWSCWARFC